MGSATTPAVVPRWEWRAFGREFRDLDTRLPTGPRTETSSRDTYLLSADPAINVKIRGGEIDVKRRLRVDRGLEQWSPVLKAAFPIAAGTVRSLFDAWSLTPPPLSRAAYTCDEWLVDVVAACPSLAVIDVDKRRRMFTVDGCTVEMAALTIGGEPLETVAVESPDPALVLQTVSRLGLAALDNENYVQALQRLRATHAALERPRATEGAQP